MDSISCSGSTNQSLVLNCKILFFFLFSETNLWHIVLLLFFIWNEWFFFWHCCFTNQGGYSITINTEHFVWPYKVNVNLDTRSMCIPLCPDKHNFCTCNAELIGSQCGNDAAEIYKIKFYHILLKNRLCKD